MKHFWRAFGYVKPQYKAAITSVLCALVVAVLFSTSIAAMLPLMKVMIGEEGLRSWVNRAIMKDRSGIKFKAVPLIENISSKDIKLGLSDVKRDSPAFDKGFFPDDIVLAVKRTDEPELRYDLTRDELLDYLAKTPAAEPVTLLVRHTNDQQENISIELEDPLGYRLYNKPANWLLGFVPQQQSSDFKQACIVLIIVIILISTLIRCTLRFIHEYLAKRIAFRSIMQLRNDTYKRAVRLPLGYFSKEGISDTMSRFVQDSNRINAGITILLGKTVREPLKIITLLVWAFMINKNMTLIVLMVAPVAGIVMSKLGGKMKRATKRSLKSWALMLGKIQGTLLGIRVVKGYHQEKYEESSFAQINKKLLKQQLRIAKIDAASGDVIEVLGITAACVGMIFAANLIKKGDMATSDFLTLVFLLGTIAEGGRKLGDVVPRLQAANASAERVYELFDATIEEDLPDAIEIGRMEKSLELQNLSFTYPGSPIPTLQNINLNIEAGKIIAVVGPNGSGKTTVLSMIPRFFVPDEGKILIDGCDVAQATLTSLRQQIGIVTQHTVVFNDTIASNIAYGKQGASIDQIVAAAKQAYADEFIEETADGYDTIIGEQGTTLSGGQLQRLAIARAILRDPAILIFDEAMSQIDSDSEAKIQKALEKFAHGRTSFIIAHRLSTIINADRIIVLDKGKLIDQGKHKQLLETCQLYRQLYEMQFSTG